MTTYAEMRKMLAQDKLAKLIETLHAATANLDADLNNQVINIAGRFSRINNQLNTGQVSHEEANMERSRISAALLDVLNRLQGAYPDAPAQVAAPSVRPPARAAAPAPQSRPVWPYVLAGVVGCIIVLAIIGMMMDQGNNASTGDTGHVDPAPTPAPVVKQQKGKSSFTDEPPPQQRPAPTTERANTSRQRMVGSWQFSLSDGSAHVVTAIHFNADGTYQSSATMNGMVIGQDYGTWRLSGNTYYQNSASTGSSQYSITWENEDQFTASDPQEGTFVTFSRM